MKKDNTSIPIDAITKENKSKINHLPDICRKIKTEAYNCANCDSPCSLKESLFNQLKTRPDIKPLPVKQNSAAMQKINAMYNYLDALMASDPVKYIIDKYECKTRHVATNRFNQWQRNYGTDFKTIYNAIREIQLSLVSQVYNQVDNKEKQNESEISIACLTKLQEELQEKRFQKIKKIANLKYDIQQHEKDLIQLKDEIGSISLIVKMLKEKDVVAT